jgi:hypothetical protein
MPRALGVAHFERPIVGKLLVRLDNGEEWEAKDADLDRFGLVMRDAAVAAVHDELVRAIDDSGVYRDLTRPPYGDMVVNSIRYLTECAIMGYDHAWDLDEGDDPRDMAWQRHKVKEALTTVIGERPEKWPPQLDEDGRP